MAVETFIVNAIEWLKNINFDEIVYGAPGKVVGYSLMALLWLYVALMIYKDAEHRYLEGSRVKYYWLVAVVLSGPLGWLLYIALRPPVDLDESYLQRVEERYLSFESRGLGYCAKCGDGVDPDFLYCTGCGAKIRERCKKCERVVEKIYSFCPSCGAKMSGKASVAILSANDVETAEKIREERLAKTTGAKKLLPKANEKEAKGKANSVKSAVKNGKRKYLAVDVLSKTVNKVKIWLSGFVCRVGKTLSSLKPGKKSKLSHNADQSTEKSAHLVEKEQGAEEVAAP